MIRLRLLRQFEQLIEWVQTTHWPSFLRVSKQLLDLSLLVRTRNPYEFHASANHSKCSNVCGLFGSK
jgi:hypothetical protein